jgi:hypothetical protein
MFNNGWKVDRWLEEAYWGSGQKILGTKQEWWSFKTRWDVNSKISFFKCLHKQIKSLMRFNFELKQFDLLRMYFISL